MFRNIPSSTLSRFFKTGSVFHFSAIYPICNPKVYKTLQEIFIERKTNQRCFCGDVSSWPAIIGSTRRYLRLLIFPWKTICISERIYSQVGSFLLFSFVRRSVFKRQEPDIGMNEVHNPSADADVKEIDFHKYQKIYKHMERWIWGWNHLFINYEKISLQLGKENWKVFDRNVILIRWWILPTQQGEFCSWRDNFQACDWLMGCKVRIWLVYLTVRYQSVVIGWYPINDSAAR